MIISKILNAHYKYFSIILHDKIEFLWVCALSLKFATLLSLNSHKAPVCEQRDVNTKIQKQNIYSKDIPKKFLKKAKRNSCDQLREKTARYIKPNKATSKARNKGKAKRTKDSFHSQKNMHVWRGFKFNKAYIFAYQTFTTLYTQVCKIALKRNVIAIEHIE